MIRLPRRYYYTHNSGLQAQSVIYTQAALDAEPEVFLDPNTFSADGTVALDSFVFSEDGSLLAYSTGRWVGCFQGALVQWLTRGCTLSMLACLHKCSGGSDLAHHPSHEGGCHNRQAYKARR